MVMQRCSCGLLGISMQICQAFFLYVIIIRGINHGYVEISCFFSFQFSIFCCDNAVLKVLVGLGPKTDDFFLELSKGLVLA